MVRHSLFVAHLRVIAAGLRDGFDVRHKFAYTANVSAEQRYFSAG
jgi:hypothetical protein